MKFLTKKLVKLLVFPYFCLKILIFGNFLFFCILFKNFFETYYQ